MDDRTLVRIILGGKLFENILKKTFTNGKMYDILIVRYKNLNKKGGRVNESY